MTSRERYLAALEHRNTDKVPFSWGLGVNRPVQNDLANRLGMNKEQFENWMDNMTDEMGVYPKYVGPKDLNCRKGSRKIDIWGVEREAVSYGAGHYDEIAYHPLAQAQTSADLASHRWPSVDWFDFSELIPEKQLLDEPKAILASNGNIFECSWYMRGFEQMFCDLLVDEELAFEILSRVTQFHLSFFDRLLESAQGQIDVVFTADDLGGQRGPLMSPMLWEQMIKPHHVRLDALIHSYGAKVMYHTDGAVMPFVEGLMDTGVDILEALQFDAADMDPVKLKAIGGDRLSFRGGISVQSTLPFGTADDVRQEVRNRIAVLANGGGYILAPSHAIQANTPVDNIFAMLEECGRM